MVFREKAGYLVICLRLHRCGEGGNCGSFKDRPQRRQTSGFLVNPRGDPKRLERISAEREEVIGNSEFLDAEHFRPDLGHLLLKWIAWRDGFT